MQRITYAMALFSSFALATELLPQTGQWEMISEMPAEQKVLFSKMKPEQIKQMQQPGMRFDPKAGTITMTLCLSQDKLKNWQHMGQTTAQHCDAPKISQSGNTITMDMQCRQPHAASIHGITHFNPARDRYEYEQQIRSQGKTMVLKGRAQRVGACKAP